MHYGSFPHLAVTDKLFAVLWLLFRGIICLLCVFYCTGNSTKVSVYLDRKKLSCDRAEEREWTLQEERDISIEKTSSKIRYQQNKL